MDIQAGCTLAQLLACPICGTRLIVLKIENRAVQLSCCGAGMKLARPLNCAAASRQPARRLGMAVGAKYGDDASGLVVRCTYAGTGRVAADGRPLVPFSQGMK
jgi:hypothetical protein